MALKVVDCCVELELDATELKTPEPAVDPLVTVSDELSLAPPVEGVFSAVSVPFWEVVEVAKVVDTVCFESAWVVGVAPLSVDELNPAPEVDVVVALAPELFSLTVPVVLPGIGHVAAL